MRPKIKSDHPQECLVCVSVSVRVSVCVRKEIERGHEDG